MTTTAACARMLDGLKFGMLDEVDSLCIKIKKTTEQARKKAEQEEIDVYKFSVEISPRVDQLTFAANSPVFPHTPTQ